MTSLPQIIKPYFQKLPSSFVALILLALCFLTYSNGLNSDFLMDDHSLITENREIGTPQFLQLNLDQDNSKPAYFRPVYHFMLSMNYAFFGNHPMGYHIVGLVLMFLASFSTFKLITMIVEERPIAFLTAILLVIHPINGVIVNYKSNPYCGMLVIAMNLSIMHYLRTLKEPRNISRYALCFIWLAIALLCHEVTIIYPLYLAIILYFGFNKNLKEIFWRTLPFFIAVGGFLLYRSLFLTIKGSVLKVSSSTPISLFDYTASFSMICHWYVAKLINLQGILLAWNAVLHSSGETAQWNIIFLLSITLIILLLWKYKRTDPEKMAILWFVVGFMPVSIACFSRPMFGFAIEPHWVLYSSIGFFLFVSTILVNLQRKINHTLWVIIILSMIGTCIFVSRQYNYIWGTEQRYCRFWLSISPDSYWANNFIAHNLMAQKNYPEARKYFKRVLSGTTMDAVNYQNLGFIEYTLGDWNKAVRYYQKSLSIDPGVADTHYWLGCAYLKEGDWPNAEVSFRNAIALDQSLIDAPRKLAGLYEQTMEYVQAAEIYQNILKLFPDDQESLNALDLIKTKIPAITISNHTD